MTRLRPKYYLRMDSFDKFYRDYVSKVNEASDVFARPLTFGEKVLFAHEKM